MIGGCHCGRVSIMVAAAPDYLNDCDCTLCASAGALWGYYTAAEVMVTGATSSYRRVDMTAPACDLHFCPNCGSSTHWTLTEHIDADRIGVNMRLFDPSALAGVELRFPAGRVWDKQKPFDYRRPHQKFGAWRDLFDRPGIDIEEPEDPPPPDVASLDLPT